MMKVTRISMIAAIATAAAAAHAYQFGVLADGVGDSYNSNTGISNEIVFGQVGPLPDTLATEMLTYVGGGTGFGQYVATNGDLLNFTFTWGPNSGGFPFGDGAYYQGVWTYSASSTGAFANMQGGGTFAWGINNGDGNGNYHPTTGLVGNLIPVPEPASIAALGIGAIALIRRRKNS